MSGIWDIFPNLFTSMEARTYYTCILQDKYIICKKDTVKALEIPYFIEKSPKFQIVLVG
jgi:hypothetical protein